MELALTALGLIVAALAALWAVFRLGLALWPVPQPERPRLVWSAGERRD